MTDKPKQNVAKKITSDLQVFGNGNSYIEDPMIRAMAIAISDHCFVLNANDDGDCEEWNYMTQKARNIYIRAASAALSAYNKTVLSDLSIVSADRSNPENGNNQECTQAIIKALSKKSRSFQLIAKDNHDRR